MEIRFGTVVNGRFDSQEGGEKNTENTVRTVICSNIVTFILRFIFWLTRKNHMFSKQTIIAHRLTVDLESGDFL